MEELLDRCSRLKSGYDTGEIWYKAIIIHSLPHKYGISIQQYESETQVMWLLTGTVNRILKSVNIDVSHMQKDKWKELIPS